ncbi:MAG: FecR domain-containing protein [Bacteroidetes bacterium]|nr:FecR domain-containing protein [Bacteroidota bacterium]
MKNQEKAEYQFQEVLPDANKAWDKLHHRFQDDNLIPEQESVIRRRRQGFLLRIAAGLLLLICSATVLYLAVNHPKAKMEMVQINTSNESNTLIKTLVDGSIVYISKNSLFSFPERFIAGQRNVELDGEAFFDISPDAAKPFIIDTKDVKVEVVGTAFNIRANDGNGFELKVTRGKVKVSLKERPSQSEMVSAGEKIIVDRENLSKSKLNSSDYPSWYRSKMHFKDESLSNILKVLNRNFNTTFAMPGHSVGSRKLTVTFEGESAETMTELICLSLNLKSQVVNDSIVLSGNSAEGRKN